MTSCRRSFEGDGSSSRSLSLLEGQALHQSVGREQLLVHHVLYTFLYWYSHNCFPFIYLRKQWLMVCLDLRDRMSQEQRQANYALRAAQGYGFYSTYTHTHLLWWDLCKFPWENASPNEPREWGKLEVGRKYIYFPKRVKENPEWAKCLGKIHQQDLEQQIAVEWKNDLICLSVLQPSWTEWCTLAI